MIVSQDFLKNLQKSYIFADECPLVTKHNEINKKEKQKQQKNKGQYQNRNTVFFTYASKKDLSAPILTTILFVPYNLAYRRR